MILLVDSGNTRVKWALAHQGLWVAKGAASPEELSSVWADLWIPKRVFIAHVGGEKAKRHIGDALAPWSAPIFWVRPEACAMKMSCLYDRRQLGVDRWVAALAAWELKRQACLVAHAGTALVVDAVGEDGAFLGGIIAPGKKLMEESLLQGTAGIGKALFEERASIADSPFPVSTGEAVRSGLLWAASGAVLRARETLLRHTPDFSFVLTGGDAFWLAQSLPFPSEIEEDLVLKGLFYLSSLSEEKHA